MPGGLKRVQKPQWLYWLSPTAFYIKAIGECIETKHNMIVIQPSIPHATYETIELEHNVHCNTVQNVNQKE